MAHSNNQQNQRAAIEYVLSQIEDGYKPDGEDTLGIIEQFMVAIYILEEDNPFRRNIISSIELFFLNDLEARNIREEYEETK